jgi:hypothetical protein
MQQQPQQQQPAEDQLQDLPVLPVEVLTNILQQVPLRERLSSCSLVCSSWDEAATATSAHLEVELSSCIRWGHVQDWLQGHAGQVTSINLGHQGHTKQRLMLPCSKLQQLKQLTINNMTIHVYGEAAGQRDSSADSAGPDPEVQLLSELMKQASVSIQDPDNVMDSSSTGSRLADSGRPDTDSPAGDLQSGHQLRTIGSNVVAAAARVPFLPQLHQLKLFSCSIPLSHLQQLSQLSCLICLDVYNCSVSLSTDSTHVQSSEGLATGAMSAALAGLTALQDLNVGLVNQCSLLALAPVRHMQRLQKLQVNLAHDDEDTDTFPAALPPSLIGLTLLNLSFVPSPAVSAQLSRLTALRELQLEELDFDPCVLAQWTQLQRLELNSMYFTPPVVSCAALFGTVLIWAGLGYSGSLLLLLAEPLTKRLGPSHETFVPTRQPSQLHQTCCHAAMLPLQRSLMGVFVTCEHVRHNKSGIAHQGRIRINHLRELPTKLNHFTLLLLETGEPQVYLRNGGCREVGEAASST